MFECVDGAVWCAATDFSFTQGTTTRPPIKPTLTVSLRGSGECLLVIEKNNWQTLPVLLRSLVFHRDVLHQKMIQENFVGKGKAAPVVLPNIAVVKVIEAGAVYLMISDGAEVFTIQADERLTQNAVLDAEIKCKAINLHAKAMPGQQVHVAQPAQPEAPAAVEPIKVEAVSAPPKNISALFVASPQVTPFPEPKKTTPPATANAASNPLFWEKFSDFAEFKIAQTLKAPYKQALHVKLKGLDQTWEITQQTWSTLPSLLRVLFYRLNETVQKALRAQLKVKPLACDVVPVIVNVKLIDDDQTYLVVTDGTSVESVTGQVLPETVCAQAKNLCREYFAEKTPSPQPGAELPVAAPAPAAAEQIAVVEEVVAQPAEPIKPMKRRVDKVANFIADLTYFCEAENEDLEMEEYAAEPEENDEVRLSKELSVLWRGPKTHDKVQAALVEYLLTLTAEDKDKYDKCLAWFVEADLSLFDVFQTLTKYLNDQRLGLNLEQQKKLITQHFGDYFIVIDFISFFTQPEVPTEKDFLLWLIEQFHVKPFVAKKPLPRILPKQIEDNYKALISNPEAKRQIYLANLRDAKTKEDEDYAQKKVDGFDAELQTAKDALDPPAIIQPEAEIGKCLWDKLRATPLFFQLLVDYYGKLPIAAFGQNLVSVHPSISGGADKSRLKYPLTTYFMDTDWSNYQMLVEWQKAMLQLQELSGLLRNTLALPLLTEIKKIISTDTVFLKKILAEGTLLQQIMKILETMFAQMEAEKARHGRDFAWKGPLVLAPDSKILALIKIACLANQHNMRQPAIHQKMIDEIFQIFFETAEYKIFLNGRKLQDKGAKQEAADLDSDEVLKKKIHEILLKGQRLYDEKKLTQTAFSCFISHGLGCYVMTHEPFRGALYDGFAAAVGRQDLLYSFYFAPEMQIYTNPNLNNLAAADAVYQRQIQPTLTPIYESLRGSLKEKPTEACIHLETGVTKGVKDRAYFHTAMKRIASSFVVAYDGMGDEWFCDLAGKVHGYCLDARTNSLMEAMANKLIFGEDFADPAQEVAASLGGLISSIRDFAIKYLPLKGGAKIDADGVPVVLADHMSEIGNLFFIDRAKYIDEDTGAEVVLTAEKFDAQVKESFSNYLAPAVAKAAAAVGLYQQPAVARAQPAVADQPRFMYDIH